MKTLGVIAVSYVLLVVALFFYMHTGDRVLGACATHGMSPGPDDLSVFPPGTGCSGGLPTFEGTYLAQDFVMFSAVLGLLAVAISAALLPGRRGRAEKLSL